MMNYSFVKLIHETTVALSFAGFFARGCGMLAGAAWIRTRPARTLPHIVDTVLLLSALALAFELRISPLSEAWLAAKIVGLIAYVALGVVALRPRRSKIVRGIAWVAALLVFGYIVSVAITKDPRGIFLMR
jgi:uncharacterized membrane protein SirB2